MFALSHPLGGLALMFMLGWTAGILVVDYAASEALIRQAQWATFPQTAGVVTKNTEPRRSGNYGWTPGVFEYEYAVGGRRHVGHRYRVTLSGGSGTQEEISREAPVGTRVRVSYNPDHPPESALRLEPSGLEVARLWLLAALNASMFGGWRLLVAPRWFRPTGPRALSRTETGWLVRLPALRPADRFAITLSVLSVCGWVVWEFGCGQSAPAAPAAWLTLMAVVAAVWAAARHARPVLGVDETDRVVWLAGGARATEVPFDAVRAVIVRSGGGSFRCELIRTDTATPELLVLASFRHEADALALAGWLRERIGLADTPPAP